MQLGCLGHQEDILKKYLSKLKEKYILLNI